MVANIVEGLAWMRRQVEVWASMAGWWNNWGPASLKPKSDPNKISKGNNGQADRCLIKAVWQDGCVAKYHLAGCDRLPSSKTKRQFF